MTQEINLTRGLVALVDDDDYEHLLNFNWHVGGGEPLYAVRYVAGSPNQTVSMHRHLMGLQHGETREVDHINGNGLDNRRCNLRICTHRENGANRRPHRNSSSPFKGVNYAADRRRWRAHIRIDGHLKHLGAFSTAEEAARAYDSAATRYFGQFARLNFERRTA